ncbi:MAG: hypothetical protein ACK40L_13265 [Hydrogenophaga sp.]
MNKRMLLVAAMAIGLSGTNAHAQAVQEKARAGAAKTESLLDQELSAQGLKNQGLYGEAGLGFLSYKISRIGFSSRPMVLRGIVGYDLYPNLAVEAMLGTGLSGGSGTGLYGTAYRASTGAMLGAYAKPRLQLEPCRCSVASDWPAPAHGLEATPVRQTALVCPTAQA